VRQGRKAFDSKLKPQAVRKEYAIHKSFIRSVVCARRAPAKAHERHGTVAVRARSALTRNRPRVSYLARLSFGIRAEQALAELCDLRNWTSGFEFQGKAVSNRKQTAVGSRVRMRARD
jgi:hypothetical protein